MSAIAWLHLSDWHQKADKEFDRTVVRQALLDDLENRADIDSGLKSIDFVVFSGDVAWSGKEEEFGAARGDLFEPMLRILGLEADRLFFVPGNHDMNVGWVREMLPAALQRPLDTDAKIQQWLTDETKRERLLEPFKSYRKFSADFTGQAQPDYASIRHLDVAGKKVALLGLNSAWMCARREDGKGGFDDRGHLLVGEPQIHQALRDIKTADLRLIVLHHPFDWLAQFDRNKVSVRLKKEAHFILFGHNHMQDIEVTRTPGGEVILVPAGAAYDRRWADGPYYVGAYNFVRLDLQSGTGNVFLRRWNERLTRWDVDQDTDGKYSFDLSDGQPVAPRNATAITRRDQEYFKRLMAQKDLQGGSLGVLGEYLAIQALENNGFQDVEPVSATDRRKFGYGNLIARRKGVAYLFEVITRRKYWRNGRLKTRYKISKMRKEDLYKAADVAADHFGAKEGWIAVVVDEGKHSVYVGTLLQLGYKSGIPMRDEDLKTYTCLVGEAKYVA